MIGNKVNKLDNNEKLSCDCDVSEEIIDFSLKNHVSDAFYGFFKNSFKARCRRAVRMLLSVSIGLLIGMLLCFICGAMFIKFFGIKHESITRLSKSYISTLFKEETISIKSSNLVFDKFYPVLIVNGLEMKGLRFNEIRIIPSIFKSIFTKGFCVDKIELKNADLEFAISTKTDNLFIKNYFARLDDKRKYIPIHQINANLGQALKHTKYSIENSNIMLRRGRDVFYLTDVSAILRSDNSGVESIRFTSKIGNISNKIKFNISSDIAGTTHVEASFNNLNSDEIKSYIKEKKVKHLEQIACLLRYIKSNLSGNVSCVIDGNTLKAGKFNLSSVGGVLVPINSGKAQQINNLNISGTFDDKTLTIDAADLKRKNTAVKISGINMSEGDIAKIDGTIELKNVSKTDLAMFPDKMTNLCMTLFNNSLPNFQLSSLKMDVSAYQEHDGNLKYNVSHGMFEVKGAEFPLADKIIRNVHASGEIFNDSIHMNIKSAKLGEMQICGGKIILYNTGHKWNGEIQTKLSKVEFINQMNILKKCKLPFDQFSLSDHVDCFFLIANSNSSTNNKFDILGGRAELRSGSRVLSIQWDKEKLCVVGDAETISKNAVNVSINMNLKTDSGRKVITIDSDDNIISSITGIGTDVLSGKYKLVLSDEWNGAIGSYSITGDLTGAILKLPAFGVVKYKNERGSISAFANVSGDIIKFNSIDIKTAKHNIVGNLEFDRSKNEIVSCNLKDQCSTSNNGAAGVSIRQIENGKLELNVTGKYLDVTNLTSMLKNISSNREVLFSIKVDQARLTSVTSVRDLKGRITIKNGNIISGGLYCVLLDGSTVVLDASKIDDNSVLNVNVSNAGQFLKELDITNSIIGGKMKMTMASEINPARDIRAINCELSDIIVKNNEQLSKIVSLSTANNVNSKNFALGFNGVVCSVTVMDGFIIINDGRAIGPMLCMSFSGSYKLDNDELKIGGIAVPVNIGNIGHTVYSPYNLYGSLAAPDVAVNPIAYTDRNILSELFGIGINDNFSICEKVTSGLHHNKIANVSTEEIKPIDHNVEEVFVKTPVNLERLNDNVKRSKKSSANKKVMRDKELGITVTRGI